MELEETSKFGKNVLNKVQNILYCTLKKNFNIWHAADWLSIEVSNFRFFEATKNALKKKQALTTEITLFGQISGNGRKNAYK